MFHAEAVAARLQERRSRACRPYTKERERAFMSTNRSRLLKPAIASPKVSRGRANVVFDLCRSGSRCKPQ